MYKKFWEWLKDKKFDVCIFLVFCLTFSMRVYALNHKTTLHFDAPASFIASTPNNLSPERTYFKYYWSNLRFDNEKNYKAIDIKKALFESKSDLKSIYKDLKTLHYYTIDPQHLNLYYSILRVWTAGMDYSDYKSIIMRGCSLNLIFFMFSFFFMYKLLSLIKNDKKFIALGLFFAFVTTGSISNFLMIRPYPFMEVFFTLAIYLFMVIYNTINTGENFSKKKTLLYSLGFATFFLTTYYSIVLVGIVSSIIIFKCIKLKDYKMLKTYAVILILGILFAYLFCPLYFENFKTIEHMKNTKAVANIWSLLDFDQYGLYMIQKLNEFIYYTSGFYIILFIMKLVGIDIAGENKLQKKDMHNFFMIFSVAILWTYVIVIISPYHQLAATRYIISSFTVLSVLLTVITYHLRKIYIINLLVLMFVSSCIPLINSMTMHNTAYKNLGVITYYNDYKSYNINDFIIKKDKELRPVIFKDKNWAWPNYIFYMPNDTIVRLDKNINDKSTIFYDYVSAELMFGEHIKIVDNNEK